MKPRGKRPSTLGRGLARGPEHNLIQSPEVLKRIAAFTGVRQQHILPALNEGVQSVLVVGDISQRAGTGKEVGAYASFTTSLAGNAPTFVLWNRTGSGKRVRLNRINWSCAGTASGIARVQVAYGTEVGLPGILSPQPTIYTDPMGQALAQTRLVAMYTGPHPILGGGIFFNATCTDNVPGEHAFDGDGPELKPGFSMRLQIAELGALLTLTGGMAWTEEPEN